MIHYLPLCMIVWETHAGFICNGRARLFKSPRPDLFDEDMRDSVTKNVHHVHAAGLLHAHRMTGWLLTRRYDWNQM